MEFVLLVLEVVLADVPDHESAVLAGGEKMLVIGRYCHLGHCSVMGDELKLFFKLKIVIVVKDLH